jgi:P27 family predicted phage terminase small subunit
MPNRIKPLPLKILEGNPGKIKLGRELPAPVDSGVPVAPEFLDAYAIEEWNRLAAGLHALGLLFESDTAAFAVYCSAISLWRRTQEALAKKTPDERLIEIEPTGRKVRQPLLRISNDAAADVIRYAGEFGLTAMARTRMSMQVSQKPKGKFGDLINGRKK